MNPGGVVVAEPKKRKRAEGAEYVSVKIDVRVYRLVRAVAAYKGKSVADLLSQLAQAPAKKAFEDMVGGK